VPEVVSQTGSVPELTCVQSELAVQAMQVLVPVISHFEAVAKVQLVLSVHWQVLLVQVSPVPRYEQSEAAEHALHWCVVKSHTGAVARVHWVPSFAEH